MSSDGSFYKELVERQQEAARDQDDAGLLTADEHAAIRMASELAGLVSKAIGDGPTRDGDVRELMHHIHCVQQAVLSQAAARAYPDRYRLLGERMSSPPAAKRGYFVPPLWLQGVSRADDDALRHALNRVADLLGDTP